MPTPNHTPTPYSDDRLSLALEIKETLRVRGHWTPENYAGPDLIMAVGLALDKMDAMREALEAAAEYLDCIGYDPEADPSDEHSASRGVAVNRQARAALALAEKE